MKTAKQIQSWIKNHQASDVFTEEFNDWFNSENQNIIPIPDFINFVEVNDNHIGIVFNNFKQCIGYFGNDNVYEVFHYKSNVEHGNIEKIDCGLIECKYEDFKIGDICILFDNAYSTSINNEELGDYMIYLNDNTFVFIDNNDSAIIYDKADPKDFSSFYKVIKLEDE